MAALPVLSGQEVVRVFEAFGWSVARQKSSHIIMTKQGENVTLSIPNHDEVASAALEESKTFLQQVRRVAGFPVRQLGYGALFVGWGFLIATEWVSGQPLWRD